MTSASTDSDTDSNRNRNLLIPPSHNMNPNISTNLNGNNNNNNDDIHDSTYNYYYERKKSREITLSEILYGVSSYHAIVKPVFLTMVLSALAVTYLSDEKKTEDFDRMYTVFSYDRGDGMDEGGVGNVAKNLGISLANGLIIIAVIAAMTFLVVILYKFRCIKLLTGYMILSSSILLGYLGMIMLKQAIEISSTTIDQLTFYFIIYNFAIVGVISIFYSKGIPQIITQGYLVATSVILAWNFSHFDDWTAWTLLVLLALYDLCAVLTPCGPLKFLVNLMQKDDAPSMPGLLYEAQLPLGVHRPSGRNSTDNSNENRNNPNNANHVETNSHRQRGNRLHTPNEAHNGNERNSLVTNPETNESNHNLDNHKHPTSTCSISLDESGQVEIENCSNNHPNMMVLPKNRELERDSGHRTVTVPLAIAKVYKLPILEPSDISIRLQRMQQRRRDARLGETTNGVSSTRNTIRNDEDDAFTLPELNSKVLARLPMNGGNIITVEPPEQQLDDVRVTRFNRFLSRKKHNSSSFPTQYIIIDRNGNVKRILIVNEEGKVQQVNTDNEEEDEEEEEEETNNSIKLGLGDFIFYSVLVSKAGLYSFTTFAACLLVILAGLGGTLVLLSVYHHALPALPISIFLGVIFYILTRYLIEPWIEEVLRIPLYM